MRNLIFVLAVFTFAACSKDSHIITNGITPTPANIYPLPLNNNTVEPADFGASNPVMFKNVLGKWAYAHDTTRWFIVKEFGEGYAIVYFPNELQSPVKRDIEVRYEMTVKGDTVDCVTPNIYPCCHFKMDGSSGYAVEYLKQDGQNEYVPVIKL